MRIVNQGRRFFLNVFIVFKGGVSPAICEFLFNPHVSDMQGIIHRVARLAVSIARQAVEFASLNLPLFFVIKWTDSSATGNGDMLEWSAGSIIQLSSTCVLVEN